MRPHSDRAPGRGRDHSGTVEYHLKRVFRKLAIDSRRQLRGKFG